MHLVTQDRADYRCMSNARLIQESKDNPTTELAIALGERIEDAIFEDASWEETARACEDENEKLDQQGRTGFEGGWKMGAQPHDHHRQICRRR